MRFTNNFADTAICVSSRATLLTGQYSRVHGIWEFDVPLAPPALADTYPMLMRRHGYRTGFVGKWGLGGPLPTDQYDHWAGYAGQGSYFEPGNPKHLTVRQGDQAIEFLNGCRADQPFCLAVSFKAPHVQDEGFHQAGMYAQYPYDHAYDGVYTAGDVPPPKTVDERPMPPFFATSFNVQREGPDFKPVHYQETMADLYRLLSGVDDAVGRIVAAVKGLGFADDTVIIYSSDHGSFYGEHGWGGKWLMYEESIRSPLVVYDPRLPHRLRGTVRDQMIVNVDPRPDVARPGRHPGPGRRAGTQLAAVGVRPATALADGVLLRAPLRRRRRPAADPRLRGRPDGRLEVHPVRHRPAVVRAALPPGERPAGGAEPSRLARAQAGAGRDAGAVGRLGRRPVGGEARAAVGRADVTWAGRAFLAVTGGRTRTPVLAQLTSVRAAEYRHP